MATAKKELKLHTFIWEGVDKRGKKVKGEQQGPSLSLVKAELRKQGIMPKKVRQQSSLDQLFAKKKQPITAKDIAIFSRQLSTMMSAGVPLVQSFDIVGRGNEHLGMQDLILKIKSDIEGGQPLAEALSRHPRQFNSLYCNLVNAGEQAGILEGLLDKIATYLEKTEAIKGKIKKALYYPAGVVVVAFIITAILMIFVIPQFKEIFEGFGAELPPFTLLVIGISEVFTEWWWAIFAALGGAVYGVKELHHRSKPFQNFIDKISLKAPIIGVILTKATIARFARTLSTMFAAGVPMVDAMDTVAGATGNDVYTRAVLVIRDEVATGQQLQASMKECGLFPNMVVQMVAIGEESGALDSMLAKVADFYEEEVDNAVDGLSSLLEPVIMAVLGVLVGGLVIAMYLPMFSMGNAI